MASRARLKRSREYAHPFPRRKTPGLDGSVALDRSECISAGYNC